MRGVYWKKRPQAGDGTVWTAAALKTAAAATAFSQAELEEAFGTRQPQKSASSRSVAVAQRGDHIALLDPRRAQNAGIALKSAGLPALGGPLRAALLAMDSAALGPARCEVLLSVAPTAEEVELLRSYDGDVGMLGMTERYFLELASVPKLMPRLRVCVGRKQLPAQAEERLASLHTLQQGLGQLRDSAALHAVLGSLLALGNALNAGTARAGAAGFSLEASLAQVCEVRCNGAPGSLLGFVALQEEKARPGGLQALKAETRGVAQAARCEAESEADGLQRAVGEARAMLVTAEAEAVEEEKAAAEEKAAEEKAAVAKRVEEERVVAEEAAAAKAAAEAEAAAVAEAEAEAVEMMAESSQEEEEGEEAWRRTAFGSFGSFGSFADPETDEVFPEAQEEAEEVGVFPEAQHETQEVEAEAQGVEAETKEVEAEAAAMVTELTEVTEEALVAAPTADAEAVVETDCYLSVLRQFVSEAEAQMSLVGEAEASFTTEAEACAVFFGEAASVSTALALLKQLDSFVTQLQAAHETNLKAEAAAQRKKQMAERQTERQMTLKPQPPSPSPAGGTPKASVARAMTPRGTPKFEECASALRSILESGGENEGGQCAPVAGGLKLRKMASSEQQRGAKESSQAAQAAELQALFLRRQSGMGMKAGNKRPV